MGFLKNLLGGKESPIRSYADFWGWFQNNEKGFFNAVKSGKNIEKEFFDKIAPKLAEIKEGHYFLVGMLDDKTVDFILTADGNLKNIVFVEDLVQAAPEISGWKFTALKPAADKDEFGITMNGYEFTHENMFFYENELPDYPDEIDITVVHEDWSEQAKSEINNGVYIFLDNYLGELEFATMVDNLNIIGKQVAQKPLRPLSQLKGYIKTRQRQFIEKYDGVRQNTENDSYAMMEAKLENGLPLIAMMNTKLLNWDAKASHPWLAILKIHYDGSNNNGMPGKDDNNLMYEIEDKLMQALIDKEGYLNVGRETADNIREIYFACKDFRLPAKIFHHTVKSYDGKLQLEYGIYKDKYWQSLERFSR